MSDTIDDYRSMKAYTQELRRKKLEAALKLFKHHDLKFSTSNNGVHCTFEIGHRVFDVWPSTDRWRIRGGIRSCFGISKFATHFKELQAQELAKDTAYVGRMERAYPHITGEEE